MEISNSKPSKVMEKLARYFFFLVAIFPPIFIFYAIQYSAITFPFWDHAELINFIVSYYDGTLNLSDLWVPHNHSRPFFYRLIYLVNAILTDWDIRSEYIYVYLAIYIGYFIHINILWRINNKVANTRFFLLLSILSILYFSPVGHNNHWWSMMLQLDLTNVFILSAIYYLSLNPVAFKNNCISAILLWCATYTLTNGIVGFFACLATIQLAHRDKCNVDKLTLFWIGNIILLLVLYLPGLPSEGGGHPSIKSLVWFFFIYLGSPIGGLIYFPYGSMFDLPHKTILNGVCGVVAFTFCCYLLKTNYRNILKREFVAIFFTMNFFFAVGSSLLTAWGRAAFDSYGVANANGSRYVIFSSYMILGLLHYVAWRFAEVRGNSTLGINSIGIRTQLIVIFFIFLSLCSYEKSMSVYSNSHQFNLHLKDTYMQASEVGDLDKDIYPNPDFVISLKKNLMKYEIGPYSSLVKSREDYLKDKYFSDEIFLHNGISITQRFRVNQDGLKAIEIQLTPKSEKYVFRNLIKNIFLNGEMRESLIQYFSRKFLASAYKVNWELYEVVDEKKIRLVEGSFTKANLDDTNKVTLRNFDLIKNSKNKFYELVLYSSGSLVDLNRFEFPICKDRFIHSPILVNNDDQNSLIVDGEMLDMTFQFVKF